MGRGWPDHSPGAVNAWLVLVTTKPPAWRDPLVEWSEHPPVLGEPHPGFFYPDPLGFWAEVRRWVWELVQVAEPGTTQADALAVAALLHLGDQAERLATLLATARPRVVLFLDEPSLARSGLAVRPVAHSITDPHRPGKVYEGFWGHDEHGLTIGKAPQHPSTHNLYRTEDMLEFLRALPVIDDL